MAAVGYLSEANIDGSDYKLVGALYGVCTTTGNTAAKEVTIDGVDALEDGLTVKIWFQAMNSAGSPTLNVNNLGAKPIYRSASGTSQTSETSWGQDILTLTYCSSIGQTGGWLFNDWNINTDTHYTAYLKAGASTGTGNAAQSNPYLKIVENNSVHGTVQLKAGSRTSVSSNASGVVTIDVSGVDTSIAPGSTSTNLPTTAAVRDYVDQVAGAAAAGALVYQGTVGSGGDIAELPAAHTKGWYYIVKTAGTYAGEKCEPGDMVICKMTDTVASDGDWDIIQANIQTLTTAEIDADWAAA